MPERLKAAPDELPSFLDSESVYFGSGHTNLAAARSWNQKDRL